MKITLWMTNTQWALSLSLISMVSVLMGCDQKPQSAQASSQSVQTQQPDQNMIQNEDSDENYTPTPRQENEFEAHVTPRRDPIELLLDCPKVVQGPLVDGHGDDPTWQTAKPIQTLDFSSQRLIEMTALHDGVRLYLRIKYPDDAPSVSHKSWSWDAQKDFYMQGLDREDMFVIKWSMQGNAIDMALRHAQPHVADIWFWKACRTNPMGYWDDKRHELTSEKVNKSLEIKSKNGQIAYLRRIGDAGQQAYAEVFPSNFKRKHLARYITQQPRGSRRDVKGKGVWKSGYWTLESVRLLKTGHDDDLQMEQGGRYLLAVACYEMAGTGVDLSYSQPLYRTGDVFDRIILVVQ